MSGAGGSGAGPMMGGSAACMTALQSQLRELLQAPPPGVNAGPADEEDMLTWIGTIQGQPGTPYEGGLFMLDLRFPPTYPVSCWVFAVCFCLLFFPSFPPRAPKTRPR